MSSSRLATEHRRKLAQILKQTAREVHRIYPHSVEKTIDIFRGDSWQLVLSHIEVCFPAAVLFRACIIAASMPEDRLDTRLAIGVGPIDSAPPKRVSEGNGEAYQASGRALDKMSGGRMKFVMASPAEQNPLIDSTIGLLDAIIQEWTVPQAIAIKGRLLGMTQIQIARNWPKPIKQQTIARHLARAHWAVVDAAVEALKNSIVPL